MEPMYYIGCSQAEDQLLREGQRWQGLRRRIASRHTHGPGPLDENAATAVERGDGSDHVHRLDLRSPQTACSRPEGGPPADAAGHCSSEKEERPIDANKIWRVAKALFSDLLSPKHASSISFAY